MVIVKKNDPDVVSTYCVGSDVMVLVSIGSQESGHHCEHLSGNGITLVMGQGTKSRSCLEHPQELDHFLTARPSELDITC